MLAVKSLTDCRRSWTPANGGDVANCAVESGIEELLTFARLGLGG